MNERNGLTGEELRKTMTNGTLLEKYISEENVNALLDYELAQMGDNEHYDMSVILYCNDLIMKNYADESYEKIKQDTYKRIKAQIKSGMNKPNRRFRFKYAVAVFIAVFTVWIGFEAVSVTSFNNNFFDGTAHLSRTVVGLLTGNTIQQDDTERSALGSKNYKTVEKFKKAEKIDIIIPMWLPDDIEIENIRYDKGETNQIHVQYDNRIALLRIVLNSTIPTDTGDAKVYESSDIKYYIFMDSNIIWWQHNENFYSLSCNFAISEYADKIIENIK